MPAVPAAMLGPTLQAGPSACPRPQPVGAGPRPPGRLACGRLSNDPVAGLAGRRPRHRADHPGQRRRRAGPLRLCSTPALTTPAGGLDHHWAARRAQFGRLEELCDLFGEAVAEQAGSQALLERESVTPSVALLQELLAL